MAFDFPSGASNGQTHTASNGTVYRYNGTTWLVDSANTTSTFDTRYLNTNGDGIISGSQQITSLGFVSESGDSTPAGTISGSKQITDLGFISSSDSITSLNTFTSSIDTTIKTKLDGDGVISGSVLRPGGDDVVSGSSQLEGYVSSSSANVIEVMTSASYALITPVSGTLYIIQG